MKNEKEILRLYACGTHDRPYLENPFVQNGYVYATDGTCLIRVSKVNIDRCYDIQDIPNCKQLFDIQDCSVYVVNIKELQDLLLRADLVPEMKESESRIMCDECGGEGVVDWEYDTFTKEFDCPYCDGEGYLNKENVEATGNMIRNPKHVLFLNGRSFILHHIEKLIKTMELMCLNSATMRFTKKARFNAVLFNLDINTDVLIMPSYDY